MINNFKMWKKGKHWLYSASVLSLLAGGVGTSLVLPSRQLTVFAQDVVNGTIIGELNGKPVIQSSVIDMGGDEFQKLVDSITKKESLSHIKYVASTIQWNSNTSILSADTGQPVGTIKDNFTRANRYNLTIDGYVDSDKGAYMTPGQSLIVTNVGHVKQLSNNTDIPVHLKVTYITSEHGADGVTNDKTVAMAIKSQSGVITVGFGNLAAQGAVAVGGQTESGMVSGGLSSSGRLGGYIDSVDYTVTLINAETGETIADDELLMAMKMSDIDAKQLAYTDELGTIAYIASPDTKLTIQNPGLASTSSDAFNADTTQLSANSYVVLKRRNTAKVGYYYTDNARNHLTIVTGVFGNTGFTLHADSTGTIMIDKSGVLSGKAVWNQLYSLEGNTFTITNKATGEQFTLITDRNGQATKSDVPFGTYVVEETTVSIGFKKTFTTQEITLDSTTPMATIGDKDDQLLTVNGTNEEYVGDVTINKSGVESHKSLWNKYYSLAGNTFTLTHQETKQVYTITTDEQGMAKQVSLPLGTYDIVETTASHGFVKTFNSQQAILTQNGQLQLTITGTNQEIKGKTRLKKVDKDTGETAQGKATLKTAQYGLFYAEDDGKHKANAPVKWTDEPNPTLLSGQKVTSSQINGKTVNHGDNIVIDVDDDNLEVAVGNLALGKYYWQEVNAPEGYSIDSTKHEVVIAKSDDNIAIIDTDTKQSSEQVIKAKVSLQKLLQSSAHLNASGYNDVAFTLTPLEHTKASVKHVVTGVKDDEDGFASAVLEYGDWVLTEDNAPSGYEKIQPIYIHMTTDEQTDVITITASHNADGSSPFSKRVFSQSDDKADKTDNITGSLSGVVSSSQPTISLSKLTLKNNTVTTEEPPQPVEPPKTDNDDFQPEKFVLNQGDFDITGSLLLDDDSDIPGNKYSATRDNAYIDSKDNNENVNINTAILKRGDIVYYQVWLDTLQFESDDQFSRLGITDTFHEYFIPHAIEEIKIYDSKTGQDVTSYFDKVIENNTLRVEVNDNGKTNGIVDVSKVGFGRYYKVVLPGKIADNAKSNVDIENVASQFVLRHNENGSDHLHNTNGNTNTSNEPIVKNTQKRVNKVIDKTIAPHKFVTVKDNVDITGMRLLDDDSELVDRYVDTQNNPYVDQKENNEQENINTQVVDILQWLTYQLWLDTTPFTSESQLTQLGMVDDFDEVQLNDLPALFTIKDSTDGKDVTEYFDVMIKEGKLFFEVNSKAKKVIDVNGKEVQIINTDILPLGRYYKADFSLPVSEKAKPNSDIDNVASQFVEDVTGKHEEQATEKRVNKVRPQSLLPQTGDSSMTWWMKVIGWIALLSGSGIWVSRFFKNRHHSRRK